MAKRAWLVASLLLALATPALASPLAVGTPAPGFIRPGLDGKPVSLEAYRGKVVLVDFWASWCPPCIIEIPNLIGLQKRHGAKLQVIGISMDDDAASAKEVASRFAFNYPLAMGDAAFGHLYGGVLGLPALFLIGRDGKIAQSWRGEIKPGELERAAAAAMRHS